MAYQTELAAGELILTETGIILNVRKIDPCVIRNTGLRQIYIINPLTLRHFINIELNPQIPGCGLFGLKMYAAQCVRGQGRLGNGLFKRRDLAVFHIHYLLRAVFGVQGPVIHILLQQVRRAQSSDIGRKAASLEDKDLIFACVKMQIFGGHHTAAVSHADIRVRGVCCIFCLVKDQHINGVGFSKRVEPQIALVGSGEFGNGRGSIVGRDSDLAVVFQHEPLIVQRKLQCKALVGIGRRICTLITGRRQRNSTSELVIVFQNGILIEESP